MKEKDCDVEISYDGGKTWQPFGMTISRQFVEELTYQLNWTEVDEPTETKSDTAKSPD